MFDFATRNFNYVVKNPRGLYSVTKAMREYKKEHPQCAWCGRSEAVHVHHVVPVSVCPERAGDPTNFITLCGKRCHITVGHFGNYRDHNPAVKEVCYVAGALRK